MEINLDRESMLSSNAESIPSTPRGNNSKPTFLTATPKHLKLPREQFRDTSNTSPCYLPSIHPSR